MVLSGQGRRRGRQCWPMPMAATWPLAQQRFLPGEQVTLPVSENPSVARVGLFGRSECDRADRGAR